ncbi:MAG: hypothetical protein IBX62_00580 [Coriobacteriia bacterium]|nr:hypothetical protein [Coriobacteriia bacterium]
MRRGRWRPLAPILLAAALLAPAPAAAQRTIALSALSFRFDVEAGGSGEGEVVVMNEGSEPMTVLVYVADQEVGETGELTFTTPDRESMTAFAGPASWVRLELPKRAKAVGNTPYMELEAGEKVPVKFRFEVPPNTPPGDHNSVIFFEMASLDPVAGGSISRVSGRIGTRLKTRVRGEVVERLSIGSFTTDALVTGDNLPYSFAVRNTGNIDKRVRAALILSGPGGVERAGSSVMTETTVYAGTDLSGGGRLDLEGDVVGKHVARLVVEYRTEDGGSTESIVEERAVWIVPAWAIGAAAGAAGLMALWLLWRLAVFAARRRARAEGSRGRDRMRRERGDGPPPSDSAGPPDERSVDRTA